MFMLAMLVLTVATGAGGGSGGGQVSGMQSSSPFLGLSFLVFTSGLACRSACSLTPYLVAMAAHVSPLRTWCMCWSCRMAPCAHSRAGRHISMRDNSLFISAKVALFPLCGSICALKRDGGWRKNTKFAGLCVIRSIYVCRWLAWPPCFLRGLPLACARRGACLA